MAADEVLPVFLLPIGSRMRFIVSRARFGTYTTSKAGIMESSANIESSWSFCTSLDLKPTVAHFQESL